MAEAAIVQELPHDAISSDMDVFSGNTTVMPFLIWGYINPVQAVAAGIVFGRPYSAPFSVR